MKANNKLENKYDYIQNKTIHDVFRMVLVTLVITSLAGDMLLETTRKYRIILILIAVISFIVISIILFFIKKYIRNTYINFAVYTILSIAYTVVFAFSVPQFYFVTTSLIVAVFTLVVANTYSYFWFLIQISVSYMLFLYFGIKERGGISADYDNSIVIVQIGAYTAFVLVLLRNIKSYYMFENLNRENIHKLGKVQKDLLFNYEHDIFSGSLNRVGLVNVLEQRLDEGKNDFYLAIIDIDGFNYLSTTLGRYRSEVLIREITFRIMKNISCEEIVKMGSDRIVLLIAKNESKEKLFGLIRKMIKIVSVENMFFSLTACVGFADADEELSATELIHNLETALYYAKTKGRDNFAEYNKEYKIKLERQLLIYNQMIRGIKNKEFYNLYQPQVNQENNQIVGFEALARWKSKRIGEIYPNEFIGIAENTGLIIEIGFIIMKNAMIFAHEASKINPNIVVSINISLQQLMEDAFLKKTARTIKSTKVNVKNIAFEVTESLYIENIDHITKILEKVKGAGIKIYLDDFGTGYSSLSYLHKLPIDTLKIDKSFVDSINEDEKSNELIKNIISLSKSLNLKCVVEGVEDEKQLELLNEFGCDYIQGYYFDKPLDQDVAMTKIENGYN